MPAPAPSAATTPSARTRELPVDIQVRAELLRMGFGDLASATFASAGLALAFALLIAFALPALRVSAALWLCAMLLVSAGRLWLARHFPGELPPDALPGWERLHALVTTLGGLGWGVSVWLFPTLTGGSMLGLLHVMILAGLLTGASRLLLATRNGSLAYLLAVTTPLAARFLANADAPGLVLGAALAALATLLASANTRQHDALAGAIAVRFEREALALRLQAEIDRAERREAELREARSLAEAAARAKGDFLANISHELRTPLNGVLGMLRALRDTDLAPSQRSHLDTAGDCAERLLLLLDDVLDLTRLDSGRLDIHRAPLSPADLARALADTFLPRARAKGLHLELHLPDNLPPAILGDSARLRQILANLLDNAIKFTERGRVDLQVSCSRRSDSEAELQFAVSDTGIGIDAPTLARLFEPFTQADSSLGRRHSGAGLGLTLSLRLARAMGGSLHAQSVHGQGATFRLVLPCTLPAASAPTPSTCRVLVVEDDPVNRQVIELFLKKLHVAPTLASDGESAVRLATPGAFDVILMDCHLPGMDGLAATRQIRRQLSNAPPVRIVALTANASQRMREDCLAAGMDDFLAKPIRLELLSAALRHQPPAQT